MEECMSQKANELKEDPPRGVRTRRGHVLNGVLAVLGAGVLLIQMNGGVSGAAFADAPKPITKSCAKTGNKQSGCKEESPKVGNKPPGTANKSSSKGGGKNAIGGGSQGVPSQSSSTAH